MAGNPAGGNAAAISINQTNQMTTDKPIQTEGHCYNGKWIKTSERIPDARRWVIATDGDEIYMLTRWDLNNPYMWTDHERFFFSPEEITHWMPLPNLPE